MFLQLGPAAACRMVRRSPCPAVCPPPLSLFLSSTVSTNYSSAGIALDVLDWDWGWGSVLLSTAPYSYSRYTAPTSYYCTTVYAMYLE